MSTLPLRALLPLLALSVAACGDSSGTGGSGNGSNNGGNTTDGGGGEGATPQGGGGSTSDGGSTNDGGGGGGGGPQPCTDPQLNVPIGDCDLYLQNCPVATDTCEIGDADPNNPAFEPITQCITKNGLKGIGESCNDTLDCGMKLTCVGNTCTPFCCPDNPQSCGGFGTCNVTVDLIDQNQQPTGYTFRACSFSQSCDLFSPNTCPQNQNCYLTDPGVTECYQPSQTPEVGDGQPCEYLNDCADSAICIGDQGGQNSVCRFLCQANSNQPPGLGGCPGGQLCDTNALDTGFAGVGFCHP